MARARVTLREARSYTKGGKTFKKGMPQIVTSASEIAYFKATTGFAVTLLDDQPPKQKAVEDPGEGLDETPEGGSTEESEVRVTKKKRRGKD